MFHTLNDHEVELVLPTDGEKPQGYVVIPNTVECEGRTYNVYAIGRRAFYQCSGLNEVLVPDTVRRIEAEAFRESGITSIQAASVEFIDYSSFYECKLLKTVDMPKLRHMWVSAFSRCEKLSSFVIPEGLEEIPHYAFDFNSFTKIVIPNTVRRIGDQAFYNCSKLETVIIPSSMIDIGSEAFSGTQIKEAIIPNPATFVFWNAFPKDCKVVRVK